MNDGRRAAFIEDFGASPFI